MGPSTDMSAKMPAVWAPLSVKVFVFVAMMKVEGVEGAAQAGAAAEWQANWPLFTWAEIELRSG